IIWDGDSKASDSFTELIVKVANVKPRMNFVAFIKASSHKRFTNSWDRYARSVGFRIRLIHSPNNLSWDELGLHVLKQTGVLTVLAFGGGEAVLNEVKKLPSPKTIAFKED